tara:strand:- start:774 stop:1121 length:348 start_codon:yes stop_codon:yes gene_type:complete
MSKLANALINDFRSDWSKPSIKFFRSNGAYGYMIWLTLMSHYFDKKNISIEEIVATVSQYGSRRTVINFINKGVDGNFIKKINSSEDKRKNLIQPTNITIKEFREWSDKFTKSII